MVQRAFTITFTGEDLPTLGGVVSILEGQRDEQQRLTGSAGYEYAVEQLTPAPEGSPTRAWSETLT